MRDVSPFDRHCVFPPLRAQALCKGSNIILAMILALSTAVAVGALIIRMCTFN